MKSKAFKGSHKHLGEHRRDVEAKIHFRLSVILRLRLRHANPIVCKAFFTQDLHLCGTAKKGTEVPQSQRPKSTCAVLFSRPTTLPKSYKMANSR